jgi:hypothetical protein
MPYTTSSRLEEVFRDIPLLNFEDYQRRLAEILREDLAAHKEIIQYVEARRADGGSERYESVRYTLCCEMGAILMNIAELERRPLFDVLMEKEKGPDGIQDPAGPRPPAKEGPP